MGFMANEYVHKGCLHPTGRLLPEKSPACDHGLMTARLDRVVWGSVTPPHAAWEKVKEKVKAEFVPPHTLTPLLGGFSLAAGHLVPT
ncbi:hypothetical protein NHX12_010259 [Muraenolepis orangiensis]|uniref:Uncharacterized protein n=1 Tax=Muraenolepis orangiensis TaxID=630683 RepID=A0A9Q0DHW2_9TELE|nr:hypothetical protein NHX12_010259 [Muraenolepis orangiensis]